MWTPYATVFSHPRIAHSFRSPFISPYQVRLLEEREAEREKQAQAAGDEVRKAVSARTTADTLRREVRVITMYTSGGFLHMLQDGKA